MKCDGVWWIVAYIYRESLKGGAQVVWNKVKKLRFVYLLQATGQDKAIKNCSPDHDRGGVNMHKKVQIASSEFSHLWADHLAGPSNISYA